MKKIILYRPGPVRQANTMSSIYGRSLMIAYGEVEENNTNGTCKVRLNNGFLVDNVKIPSTGYPSKDPILGGITYPPLKSKVTIEYPENDLNSAMLRPSYLDYNDDDVKSTLLSGGDKSILPGGWEYTYDQETGEIFLTNGDFFLLANPDTKEFVFEDFNGNTIESGVDRLTINGNVEILQ